MTRAATEAGPSPDWPASAREYWRSTPALLPIAFGVGSLTALGLNGGGNGANPRHQRVQVQGRARVGGSGARQADAPARQLYWGGAAVSFSVLADSAVEHYKGGFHNPVMYIAPAVAGLSMVTCAAEAVRPRRGQRVGIHAAAVLTGLIGFGFHVSNISRRIGGWSADNLFYGPPIAAPLGLVAAGLMGVSAGRLRSAVARRRSLPSRGMGRILAPGVALALLGTAGEAGMLHFRGGFHRPAMYVPVSLPPAAAVVLAVAALRPSPARRRVARALLRATAAAGLAGVAFHAHGIHRSMGGWRNWSQNLLAGPPIPAPPSFTGIAIAGLAALSLLGQERE